MAMVIKDKIEKILGREITLVHPKDLKNGDYTIISDEKTAQDDYEKLKASKPEEIEKVELVNKRFINIYLSKEFFKNSLKQIIEDENFGKSDHAKGFKVMVEHTDPNPFKEFHIGHLMPNVIGSAISRVFEWNGAEVKQVNYQGDKGLHVAKAVWGMMNGHETDAYAWGHKMYEENAEAKKEIEEINKKIYEQSDEKINKIYDTGREFSLTYFEHIYKRLGTKFDHYFFESETGETGKQIVKDNLGKVFEEGENGAIIYKGSHTRVFINSFGLPTYEAKDLGNAKIKYDYYPYDLSVIVTANEIKDYFKVVLEAMEKVLPDLAKKTKHLPHGMLLLPGRKKMSSRTGDIIPAEVLIENVRDKVKGDEQVAVGAIKYMILRQAIGNDIIFDIEKSVSTEGDSGVYLQYAYARSNSLLEKSDKKWSADVLSDSVHEVEKLLYRFPEVVERAGKEYAPHFITTYITELAGAFNNLYAHEQILGNSYNLAITKAFNTVMKNGLTILGIPVLERM